MEVAVVVLDGVADFGLSAVLEAFGTANGLLDQLESPPEPWRVRTASLGSSVRSGFGHLIPTTPLHELSADIDLIIVPAVHVLDAEALVRLVSAPPNHPILERISVAYRGGTHLAAACTGTFLLAESGVLNGLSATTSWWLGPALRRRYPQVTVDEGRILCREERVITAGASLSHLHMALSLIAARSLALSELVARYMVVGDRSTQLDFAIPEVYARGDSLVATLERWVRDHIAEQFHVADAAAALGVTTRSLQRATQDEIGMSPKDFVDEIRLEHATQLLRSTTLTLDAVAAKIGYLNAATLRALARRRRGRTIAELRNSPLSLSLPTTTVRTR